MKKIKIIALLAILAIQPFYIVFIISNAKTREHYHNAMEHFQKSEQFSHEAVAVLPDFDKSNLLISNAIYEQGFGNNEMISATNH